MKPGARVLAAAFVALALAGCSQPPEEAPAAPAAPPPVFATHDFGATVYIGTPYSCAVAACSGGVNPGTLYLAAGNASIQALRFDVEDEPLFDGTPIQWTVTCTSPVEEDPVCLRALADGRDELPVHVEVPGLDLTPGTEVFLELAAPTLGVPLADFPLVFGTQGTPVRGSVDVVVVPGFEGPPRLLEVIPISVDGHSGPCALFLEIPACAQYPGGSQFDLEADGRIVAANLTMTWDSRSPLDQELVLEIHEYSCPGTCPEPAVVQGPSPLVLRFDGLRFAGTSTIAVYHADEVDDPLGHGSYQGTRTPVHVEGSVTVELQRDEGGSPA